MYNLELQPANVESSVVRSLTENNFPRSLGLQSRFVLLPSELCSLLQKDGISLWLSRSLSVFPASRIL